MTKLELLDLMDEIGSPYPRMILDIYDDHEQIPDGIIEMITKPSEPRIFVAYMGERSLRMYNDIMEDFVIMNNTKKITRELQPTLSQKN